MALRAIIAALALGLPGGAAYAATATATANAVAIRPLSLLRLEDMEFGSLVPSAAAGTATINPNTDTRSTTGGVIGVTGATPSAAHFVAAGSAGSVALILLPGNITLTRGGGTETMLVSAISSNSAILRTFPVPNTIDIAIGGTLNVAANQVAGSYAGTFTLTVLYF